MTFKPKARISLSVHLPDEEGEKKSNPLRVTGREAWALRKLINSGPAGVSAFDNLGPRLSHYIFKLRGYGLTITTEHETHGGPFPGTHARYRLGSKIEVVDEAGFEGVSR